MNENHTSNGYYTKIEPYEEEELTLYHLWMVLRKWKVFIAAMVIIAGGVAAAIIVLKYPIQSHTEAIIELNFAGMETHNYPDGSSFDQSQIIAPSIMATAIAKLKYKVSEKHVRNLKSMIRVKSIIPPEIKKEMEQSLKRNERYKYFPNQFVVAFTTDRGDVFSAPQKEELLLAIINTFRKNFEHKFGEEPLVAINFPEKFLEEFDYLDILQVYSVKLDNFLASLNKKIDEAGFFRSAKTGLSFADIRNDIQLIQRVTLSNLEALIKNTELTKNKETLIHQYRSKIEKIELTMKKKDREAMVARELLREMQQAERFNMASRANPQVTEANVMIDSSLIKNLIKNDYYSLLLKRAMDAGIEAQQLGVEKEYLEEKIRRIERNNMSADQEKQYTQYVGAAISRLNKELPDLAQRANELNAEYLKNMLVGAIKILQHPVSRNTRAISMQTIFALAMVFGFFAAFFIAVVAENIRTASHNHTENNGSTISQSA